MRITFDGLKKIFFSKNINNLPQIYIVVNKYITTTNKINKKINLDLSRFMNVVN